jgi:hypothetical protein
MSEIFEQVLDKIKKDTKHSGTIFVEDNEDYRGFSDLLTDNHLKYISDNLLSVISKIKEYIKYNENCCKTKQFKNGTDCYIDNIGYAIDDIILKKLQKNIKLSWKELCFVSSALDITSGEFTELNINEKINCLLIATDSTLDKTNAIYNSYLINTIIPLDEKTKPIYKHLLYNETEYSHAMIEGIYVYRTVKNPKFDSDVGYRIFTKLWAKKVGVMSHCITGEFEQSLDGLPEYEKNLHKFIRNYISNLHNFINHPEIEIITKSYYNNEQRVKRGQTKIPTKCYVNITGKLKKYIDETTANNEKAWELGHKFWVRGHWMEFRDECYKNMKGKKKWVLPYIKGKGELINKEYYIGEKEQCWENQKRMIKLIQSIFPGNKVEKNNRTTLDGLEIDCYLPELKLGFEYNGKQHYEWIEVFHKTKEDFELQVKRDIEKNQRALEKGIKIITIRYNEPLTEDLIKSKLL